ALKDVRRTGRQRLEQGARVLVRAVLAPQRADDAELREGRLAAEHGDETLVLVGGESMLGDERRRDERIAGPGFDPVVKLHQSVGFLGGGGGDDGDVPRLASAAVIMCGELLVPE